MKAVRCSLGRRGSCTTRLSPLGGLRLPDELLVHSVLMMRAWHISIGLHPVPPVMGGRTLLLGLLRHVLGDALVFWILRDISACGPLWSNAGVVTCGRIRNVVRGCFPVVDHRWGLVSWGRRAGLLGSDSAVEERLDSLSRAFVGWRRLMFLRALAVFLVTRCRLVWVRVG